MRAWKSRKRIALVHTDVGFHNMAIDAPSLKLRGLFDYADAAWTGRHDDFRYLIFDLDRCELLDTAISAYEAVLNCRVDRERVLLYNAACAITFLAHRAGIGPESDCNSAGQAGPIIEG
jgi:hypothetical protein